MENLEQKYLDVLSITSRHETQSAKSVREYSDAIPTDLLIDIFSRVPAKSIARFRCLSKLWESILRCSYFTDLFLTNAPSRPRLLLFVFRVKDEAFFFTSPQPQNPHDNSSLVATRYHKLGFLKYFPPKNSHPLCGFVLLDRVVCNPVTGESITLHKVIERGIDRSRFFGYDPINKQFKVLCMTTSSYDERLNYTYQVLTLNTGKPCWRKIECNLVFGDYGGEVCINGFLYSPTKSEGYYVIVCFDVRLDEFSLVTMDDKMLLENCFWRLFNYKGKLVVHKLNYDRDQVMLWVREDAEKHKWSKCICIQLPSWNMGLFDYYSIVGMTDTGEIVFSPIYLSNPFYVVYYNVETATFTRVNIQGFEEFKQARRILPHT